MFELIYVYCSLANVLYIAGSNILSTNKFISKKKVECKGDKCCINNLTLSKWSHYQEDIGQISFGLLLGPFYTYRILLGYAKYFRTNDYKHIKILTDRHSYPNDYENYWMWPIGHSSWVKLK
jgi:hypothetical protein